MTNLSSLLNIAAQAGTALGRFGILVATRQLRITSQQALTTFEDSLAHEYRDLAARLPTKALLGEPLSQTEQQNAFDEFYHYFDLSNEQVFLRQIGRVSQSTWTYWRDGIKSNLGRPAFACAWDEINNRAPKDFSELRRLIQEDFKQDPKKWNGTKRTNNSLP